MYAIENFFKENHNLYIYLLFIISILIFAFIARAINHFILMFVRKSPFQRKGMIESFTPFLILFFLIAGESISILLFKVSQNIENSFSFFLNTQIIWALFWLFMVIIKVGIYELPASLINLRKLYPSLRALLLVILLALTITKNLEHIISSLLGFVITILLLKISYTINQIPIIRLRAVGEEESERIVARWDSFLITLPYNISKETIDTAIRLAGECVKKTDNVGNNFSVLLKDLSERGIVIEVKYLVLDSTKMKETRHNILSLTLNLFSGQGIPMSSS